MNMDAIRNNIDARRNNQLCITTYQVNNNLTPQYLIDLFCNNNLIHDHETRYAEDALFFDRPFRWVNLLTDLWA